MIFKKNTNAVSPVIGVIIAVAITVILASIAYVWFMSFTEHTEKSVVEPLRVKGELNIERIHDELAVEIIIGRNINWDDYTVTLNFKEVTTRTGTISTEGDVVYFDYQGPPLAEGNWYIMDIIDNLRNTVVFTDEVFALSDIPEGSGVYGIVTSADDGKGLPGVLVRLYDNEDLINTTTTDPTGAYTIGAGSGVYTITAEIDSNFPESFGVEYESHSHEVAVGQYYLIRHDVALMPNVPETATLTGTVHDDKTGQPLVGAKVHVTDNKFFSKVNHTDANGNFRLTMPAANMSFFCELEDYKKFRIGFLIGTNETKSLEIRLEHLPVETARVYGKVFDNKTGAPLDRVNVFAETSYGSNFSKTDETGYFEIHVAPGNVTLFVNTADYEFWTNPVVVIADQESREINIYLDAEKN